MDMSKSRGAAKSTGLSGAVKLVVKNFLEQDHYRQLHRVLAKQWSDCHSLTAAVRLMEAHGVRLSQKDQEHLCALPEDKMIDALVMKMPQQSREQFEHFFLQLSLIASTTTRLRAALESGNTQVLEEVLDAAENVGILQFILKMAVTQAGNEVMTREAEHDNWLTKTAITMAPLLRGQADAMITQKALAQTKAQLTGARLESNEKSRKVLVGIISNQAQTLVVSVFSTWADHTSRMKKENEIRVEYEEQIEAAEKRLFDYREAQLKNVRGVVMRQAADGDTALVAQCFIAIKQEIDEQKFTRENGAAMAELQDKLKNMADTQSANAKKVLGRMNAESGVGLMTYIFQAWVKFWEDYNKNKEYEDALKESEKKVAEFMKNQNDGAKSVLNRMNQGSNTGLLGLCIKSWVEFLVEEKKMLEMKEIMENNAAKFASFTGRNKDSADSVMQKYAEAQDIACILAPFQYWKREAKCEGMKRYGKEKDGKRKDQLKGVKNLFKDFASELDAGLKQGTPRIDPHPERTKRRQAGGSPSPERKPSPQDAA